MTFLNGIKIAVTVTAVLISLSESEARAQSQEITCKELTADWPLWTALSRKPWNDQQIAAHEYAKDDPDPEGTVAENAQGAFRGHGGDMDLSFSDEALTIISHMLEAPTPAVCGDAKGETLRAYVDRIAHGYPPLSYAENKEPAAPEAADPLLAAFGVIEFGYFKRADEWSSFNRDETGLAFARDHFHSDHNPLWAVAVLERSRDHNDLVEIDEAISRLRSWPNLSEAAQARYVWRLVAQYVRVQLEEGHLKEAAEGRRYFTDADLKKLNDSDAHPDIQSAAAIIMGSGVRLFIRHDDYQSARNWAVTASQTFGIPIPEEIKPVLSRDLEELYGTSELGLTRKDGVAELGPARAVFDTFSAQTLIQMSHQAGMSASDRRALVGAAWTRAYALNRPGNLVAWLPDMKGAYPELAGQVDAIASEENATRRHHLITHLLLKSPGLVALPSWARPPGGPRRLSSINKERPADISAFDSENANDGNWWCEPEPAEVTVNSASILVGSSLGHAGWFDYAPPFSAQSQSPEASGGRRVALASAEKRFSIYPILRFFDGNELAQFGQSGSATKRLIEDALQWATEYGSGGVNAADAPIVAETLALSVRATRYGCHRGQNNGKWSKAAFEALHRYFPKSDWAAQTKSWYGHPTPLQHDNGLQQQQALTLGVKVALPQDLTFCSGEPELKFLRA